MTSQLRENLFTKDIDLEGGDDDGPPPGADLSGPRVEAVI